MANASWNLLIYANDDDVVLASAMRRAIDDMRNTPLPADCRIVVQFNTAARKELHWISNGHYEMEPGARVTWSEGTVRGPRQLPVVFP